MNGERLQEWLDEHDIAQSTLARAIHIDSVKMNRSIKGTRRFTSKEDRMIRVFCDLVDANNIAVDNEFVDAFYDKFESQFDSFGVHQQGDPPVVESLDDDLKSIPREVVKSAITQGLMKLAAKHIDLDVSEVEEYATYLAAVAFATTDEHAETENINERAARNASTLIKMFEARF